MEIAVLLFDNYELLDACGPIEILSQLPDSHFQFVSLAGGLVRSSQGMATLTELVAQEPTDILIIPGGLGSRELVEQVEFLTILQELAENADHVLSICTGSALLARTGLLNGRKATSNKMALDWVKAQNSAVNWQNSARWVVSGKFYMSSGVSAGMDMALGFVADQFGEDKAKEIAEKIEYIWHKIPSDDPFSRN